MNDIGFGTAVAICVTAYMICQSAVFMVNRICKAREQLAQIRSNRFDPLSGEWRPAGVVQPKQPADQPPSQT